MGPSLLRLLAATVLATAAVSQPALAMRDGAPGRAGAHAAFSKTASGVDHEFCQLRAPVSASQLAEPRRENGCVYGRSAKDITKDPNGYQDSVNQYAYGANDPINHRDPTGMFNDGSRYYGLTPEQQAALRRIGDPITQQQVEAEARIARGLSRIAGASELFVPPAPGSRVPPIPDGVRTLVAASEVGAGATGVALGIADHPYTILALSALDVAASVGPAAMSRVRNALDVVPTLEGALDGLAAQQEAALQASFASPLHSLGASSSGRRALAGEPLAQLSEVLNPTGCTTNCSYVSLSMERWLATGDVSPAPSREAGRVFDIMLGELPGGPVATGRNVRLATVRKALRRAGPGSRALVAGYRARGPGHAFNAVNIDGEVHFLDAQVGRSMGDEAFSSYTDYSFVITSDLPW